ncbi:MAG: hypothetical protein KJ058_16165 [Thermoanaerobaculia bacterium]|nr:hypothetical protein [Thermoanaerobaculia bacterium]
MRRRAAVLGLLLGAALLAGGHWRAHYAPRERAAGLRAASGAAALLADPAYPVRLWIAHPHQNLGALEEGIGDLDGWLAAVGRLAGLEWPPLARFGPFVVPPAGELALGLDPAARRGVAVARLHPAAALLARAAGAVAGNPWLAGGAVAAGADSAEVAWRGREWVLRVGGAPLPGSAAPSGEEVPAIARLVLGAGMRERGLPLGAYRLERTGGELWLRAVFPRSSRTPALPRLGRPGLALFLAEAEPGGSRAFGLWRGEGATPDAAVLAAGGAETWSLPGEGLLRLAGRNLREGEADGWRARGYSRRAVAASLAAAAEMAPVLAALGPEGGRAVWADPSALASLASDLADLLAALPLARRAEAGRWRDLATALAPLAPCREAAARLPAGSGGADGPALLLCGPGAAD